MTECKIVPTIWMMRLREKRKRDKVRLDRDSETHTQMHRAT